MAGEPVVDLKVKAPARSSLASRYFWRAIPRLIDELVVLGVFGALEEVRAMLKTSKLRSLTALQRPSVSSKGLGFRATHARMVIWSMGASSLNPLICWTCRPITELR